jgi:hypothetical protein
MIITEFRFTADNEDVENRQAVEKQPGKARLGFFSNLLRMDHCDDGAVAVSVGIMVACRIVVEIDMAYTGH